MDKSLAELQRQARADGDLGRVVSVDSTVARAPQEATDPSRGLRGSIEQHGFVA